MWRWLRWRRGLSARRPLAWRLRLPALALGLIAGQVVAGGAGRSGTALVGATLLAAPALLRLDRAAGTAGVLAAAAATSGALQVEAARWRATTGRAERLATSRLEGRVVAVRGGEGRRGTSWARLDVALAAPTPPFFHGDRVRISIWDARRAWRVGETVRVRAALRPPRGLCNGGEDGYALALARAGVVATASLPDERGVAIVAAPVDGLDAAIALARARQAIAAAIAASAAGDDERAVLHALVLGDQTLLPRGLRNAYARTGTAHVLAVSGLHVALVAATAWGVVRWCVLRAPALALRIPASRVAAAAAVLPALGYAALSGGAVATVRALVMGGVGLGAIVLLRRPDVGTAIAAAALALAIAEPGVAERISFQLSFAAVLALVVAGGRFRDWQRRWAPVPLQPATRAGRVVGWALGAIVLSAAAALATSPLTAYHFGSVALVGMLANLVVVPLVGGAALLCGLAAAALAAFSAPAASFAFDIAAAAIQVANRFVVGLAAFRFAALDVGLTSRLEVAAALALAASLCLPRGRGRRRSVAIAAALVALLVLRALLPGRASGIEVELLDVGQGDAAIVQLPGAHVTLLVDGGGSAGSFDPGERVLVPTLRRRGIRSLDAMVLSHAQLDHYGGLAAVARALPVGELWWNGRPGRGARFAGLMGLLSERGVRLRVLRAGEEPLAGARAGSVRVVHPDSAPGRLSDNDASLVLQLTYGASRVLLTGDVEAAAEASLLAAHTPPAATVLKVPHHGSRTSSTRELVAAVRPGLAVASLGAHNRFGFPAPEVRRRYRRLGAAWRDTGADGAVHVVSDGQLERAQTCR